MTFFLKIYDNFSFLVHMMLSVFVDLKSFLMYFSIFIFAFSLFIALLIDLQDDVYSGLGFAKYFVLVLRTSVGDN